MGAFFAKANIEHFHTKGESHTEIDVAFGYMVAKAFCDQHHTDHHQKTQSQHLDRGVGVNKLANTLGKQHHQTQRNDDCCNHDAHIVDHTHGGDDGVKRKHQVDEHDLHNDGRHIRFGIDVRWRLVAFKRMVNFTRAFPNKEQTASEQNQIAPRKGLLPDGEQRLDQTNDH